VVSADGEALSPQLSQKVLTGYLLGSGNAVERLSENEFHRFRHVPESDRRAAEEYLAV
jgi:hypothetical protein